MSIVQRRHGGFQGIQLFASSGREPRARRPTDLAMAIVGVVVLVLVGAISQVGSDLDEGLADLFISFPSVLDPLWVLAFWAPSAWVVVLLITGFARQRWSFAVGVLAGLLASFPIAAITGAAVDDTWSFLRLYADLNGPPAYPLGALTLATAGIATASPHVSRPFRHFGRWLIAAQLVGALFLGATHPSGAAASIAVGLVAAAAVHLALGSPGGRPTTSRIVGALAELGVDVVDLEPAPMQREGVMMFTGQDADGPLSVKVYGRDAWDGQLLATLWRLVWYRGNQRTVHVSRLGLVEHEGFVTLLAERAGVGVPRLVTAGSAGLRDALVVMRPDGQPLSATAAVGVPAGSTVGAAAVPGAATDGALNETAVDGLWLDLQRLHRAGITHRRIDLDRLVLRPDGSIGLGDLSSASVADLPSVDPQDRAQLLAVSVLLLGEEAAVAAARRALGDDELVAVLPYVQDVANGPRVRAALDDADIDLDDVRARIGETLGAEGQDLIRLRRVTVGSVLNMALLAIAAYTIIGLVSGLDLDSFSDSFSDARWWWLAFALFLAQLPRFAGAVSTMGSLAQPLPLGPLTALQFAITYVNLAIPSTAARVAINVRFFQRFGVTPATALAAGVIESVVGFVVQIGLFLLVFMLADTDLGLSTDGSTVSGLATFALVAVVVVAILLIVAFAVPSVRQRIAGALREARQALGVLRDPTKLAQLFLGNVAAQVIFALALAASVRGFGEDVPLTTLLLINTVVSLFAGLLPVPGGIGVSEAGIALGLTTAGLSTETAFAAAIAYRMASFYLPPIWGVMSYRWLVARRYL